MQIVCGSHPAPRWHEPDHTRSGIIIVLPLKYLDHEEGIDYLRSRCEAFPSCDILLLPTPSSWPPPPPRIPYRTTVYITPPWSGFPSSIAGQPRGCQRQYRTIRSRGALGEMLTNADLFGTDTIPTVCGDIDHGQLAQPWACDILRSMYTVEYGNLPWASPVLYHRQLINQLRCLRNTTIGQWFSVATINTYFIMFWLSTLTRMRRTRPMAHEIKCQVRHRWCLQTHPSASRSVQATWAARNAKISCCFFPSY